MNELIPPKIEKKNSPINYRISKFNTFANILFNNLSPLLSFPCFISLLFSLPFLLLLFTSHCHFFRLLSPCLSLVPALIPSLHLPPPPVFQYVLLLCFSPLLSVFTSSALFLFPQTVLISSSSLFLLPVCSQWAISLLCAGQ